MRPDTRGLGTDRWRMRRVRNSYGQDPGSAAGKTLLDQDFPGVGLFQVSVKIAYQLNF